MSVATTIEAAAAGVAAGVTAAEYARRRFRHAVQEIVDRSVSDVIRRQSEFETRVQQHLTHQDGQLSAARREIRNGGG